MSLDREHRIEKLRQEEVTHILTHAIHARISLHDNSVTDDIEKWSRAAIVNFIAFIVGGLFFAWNLLVVYAFSSMVNPELPSDQRTAEIFRRFLLGESIAHIIMVTGLIAATLACFALAAIEAWTLITETKPALQTLNITAAIALAILIVGLIYYFSA